MIVYIRQSVAITSLGVVNLIIGGLSAAGGVSSLILFWALESAAEGERINKDQPAAGTSFSDMMDEIGLSWAALSFGMLIFGCLFMASGYGLIRRRMWGRYLALFLATVVGLSALASLFSIIISTDLCGMLGFAGYCLYCFVVLFKRKNVAEFDKSNIVQ